MRPLIIARLPNATVEDMDAYSSASHKFIVFHKTIRNLRKQTRATHPMSMASINDFLMVSLFVAAYGWYRNDDGKVRFKRHDR